jgi:hypothetical protein
MGHGNSGHKSMIVCIHTEELFERYNSSDDMGPNGTKTNLALEFVIPRETICKSCTANVFSLLAFGLGAAVADRGAPPVLYSMGCSRFMFTLVIYVVGSKRLFLCL